VTREMWSGEGDCSRLSNRVVELEHKGDLASVVSHTVLNRVTTLSATGTRPRVYYLQHQGLHFGH
jgi:hypothetical protein